jgi:hypothetical protein
MLWQWGCCFKFIHSFVLNLHGFSILLAILPLSQTLKLTLRGTLFIEHFGFVQTDGFLSLTQAFDFLCKLVLVYKISLLWPMTQQPCLGLQEELWNESSKIWDISVSVLFACKLATLTTFSSLMLKTLGRIFVTHGSICFISPCAMVFGILKYRRSACTLCPFPVEIRDGISSF